MMPSFPSRRMLLGTIKGVFLACFSFRMLVSSSSERRLDSRKEPIIVESASISCWNFSWEGVSSFRFMRPLAKNVYWFAFLYLNLYINLLFFYLFYTKNKYFVVFFTYFILNK